MSADPTRHHWITAPSALQRSQLAMTLDLPPVVAHIDAHRRLRGPYTAAGSLVRALAPEALSRCPELIAKHDVEVLAAAPELRGVVPCQRQTLMSTAPLEERTRYYPASWTRRIAHGLVELARDAITATWDGPRTVVLDRIDEADATDVEWVAILLRRIDARRVRLVIGTSADVRDGELAEALERHATRLDGSKAPERTLEPRDPCEFAARYVASECTSDDAQLRAAYHALAAEARASLHDARAQELERCGEASLGLGAIPFHRERGADPGGAGARALLAGLQHCMLMGFYDAVLDLGRRSHKLLDWTTQPDECWLVIAKMASALNALRRPHEAAALYDEACAHTTLPKAHLYAAYGRAMLYARHFEPDQRDRTKAKAWINTAAALAGQSPDPRTRAFSVSFIDNARALIEVRLGNSSGAVELVTRALDRLDQDGEDNRHLLHRSVLRYNRAQLLDRFGTPEEALAEYSQAIAQDSNQSEYYMHRAAVHHRLRNVDAARADLDRAIEVSPPYPEPNYARAQLALEVGDLHAALSDLSYVLELDPGFGDAWVDRASVLIELGDHDGALRDAEAGLALDGTNAELHALRGSMLHAQGRLDDAQEAYAKALRCDPTLAPAWSNLGALWYTQGDIARAIDDLTRALELSEDPDVRANRALAFEAAGRHREAAADRELAQSVSGAGDRNR